MVKQTIQIFARIKPTKAKTGLYELNEDGEDGPLLSFNLPRDAAGGYINNKKEEYKFKFEKVFDRSAKQDEIFVDVAQPVIDNVLQGYNGTIFAYGQTGSGKTFTITGGAERFIDRGIIPRTLSYIFEHCKNNPEYVFTVHVSYLEIYNDSGYDLLDPKHEASKLEDLPKVSLMEDSDQNIHLKNLSTHQANNEEDALNLLFLGDTNRMIAETPMNQASTRSHCIFTVHVSSREAGSATIRNAKLHLVDLAGSERVSKTGVNGTLLKEAKYINLSLHYLEQVIVSLSEKGRGHIPYRNSMMTSVLRDSLGGNCMTTMIATCSVEKKNLDESISTCRFAQRVALIKNDAILNEELDPKLLIARLKKEIAQLKEELAMATGEQRTDELSDEDLERCREAVQQYLDDMDPEATLNIGADMRKIQQCYTLLKKAVLSRHPGPPPSSSPASRDTARDSEETAKENYLHTAESKKLRDLVLQRDNEINILVNMLKKEKKRALDATSRLESLGHPLPARPVSEQDNAAAGGRVFTANGRSQSVDGGDRGGPPGGGGAGRANTGGGGRVPQWSPQASEDGRADTVEETAKRKILGELSMGRQEAFEIFRRDYQHNGAIEENKRTLRARYTEAKQLGERVNKTRAAINKVKSSIEQHRMARVMQGLVDPERPEPDEMENQMKEHMEQEKANYKEAFQRLRTLKTEIEHLQHLLEKSKMKLMKDFELWWAEQAAKLQQNRIQQNLYLVETAQCEGMVEVEAARYEQTLPTPSPSIRPVKTAGTQRDGPSHLPPSSSSTKSAWRTPPITPQHQSSTPAPNHAAPIHAALSSASSTSSLQSDRSSHPVDSRLAPIIKHSGGTNSSGYSSASTGRPNSARKQNKNRAPPSSQQTVGGIQLTGDAEADADIMAFVKARQNVVKHAQQGFR